MTAEESVLLSESESNIVENLACRVTERSAGKITPSHLVPYLPMSLGLIKSCLDEMVDGTSVLSEIKDNHVEYEFAAYKDSAIRKDLLDVGSCVSCDGDLSARLNNVLCPACSELLRKELNNLAEKMGWPAQAVYEHEILYNAAKESGPTHAASLAGSSRYTLRSMRRKLDRLTLENHARQELDEETAIMIYYFPEITYPRESYQRNMAVVRSYPASVMEEVQIKVVKILFSLGLMVLGMLALAFWGIPFPLLLIFLFIAGPITAFLIWRHRSRPDEG